MFAEDGSGAVSGGRYTIEWIASGWAAIQRNPERRPAQYVLGLVLPGPFGVIGANMGCKRFVALQLEVAHHFIERCAGGRTRRSEPPATFRATKTPKTRLLNPYQLPAHGRLCRCASTSTRFLSGGETFWFAINGSFRSGVLPDCSRKPSPSLGVAEDAQEEDA
jgi:hypothetical protein